jgi:hypothetical protein
MNNPLTPNQNPEPDFQGENDLRQEYRLNNQLTVVLELGTQDNGEPILLISQSLDISANGLRVIADRAVDGNCILRCCIRHPPSDTQFLLVGEVKWCLPYNEGSDSLIGLSLFESEGTDIVQWKEFIAQSFEKPDE